MLNYYHWKLLEKVDFDEIFFLDLQNDKNVNKFFKLHIKEFRPNTWDTFDYPKIS